MRRLSLPALAFALLSLGSHGPGQAQRLAYDFSGAPLGPRLPYHFQAEVPPPPIAGGASAAGGEEEARRRPKWLQYSLLDRLEWASHGGQDGYSWDYSAFLGGEASRVWITSAGDGSLGGSVDYLEFQALYSHVIAEGWDLQAGVRFDVRPYPDRLYFALGGQADVTDALWLGAHAYLSDEGELSARTYGQYNLELIGPLVLQPSFELGFYGNDIPELGIGRGLSYGEAGLRLRWKLADELFAPYFGASWERLFGRTARMARDAGDEVSGRSLVVGVRSEF